MGHQSVAKKNKTRKETTYMPPQYQKSLQSPKLAQGLPNTCPILTGYR